MQIKYGEDFEFKNVTKSFVEARIETILQDTTFLPIVDRPNLHRSVIGTKNHDYSIVKKRNHIIISNNDTKRKYNIYLTTSFFEHNFILNHF